MAQKQGVFIPDIADSHMASLVPLFNATVRASDSTTPMYAGTIQPELMWRLAVTENTRVNK